MNLYKRKILFIFCLIVLVNLLAVSTFGSPGKRTYKGVYELEDVVGDVSVKEEYITDKMEIVKDEEKTLEEEPIELPKEEKFIEEQSFQGYTTGRITDRHNFMEVEDSFKIENSGITNSAQESEKEIHIISHDHIPLGSEYKMKE